MLAGNAFGEAASRYARGISDVKEASFYCPWSRRARAGLATRQESQAALAMAYRPQTGGWAAYSPCSVVTDAVHQRVRWTQARSGNGWRGMAAEGNVYTGLSCMPA